MQLVACGAKDSTRLVPIQPAPSAAEGSAQLPAHESSGAAGLGGPEQAPSIRGGAGSTRTGARDVDSTLGAEPLYPLDAGALNSDAGLAGGEVVGLDARPVGTAFLGMPQTAHVTPPGWVAVEAFPALRFDNPVSFNEAPGTGQIFVTEQRGRVFAFANDPATTDKKLVLDLSSRTQAESDSGLLGLAFHPEFGQPGSPNRGYVYLHYAFNPQPIIGRRAPYATQTLSRLARFSVDLDSLMIDPASEQVLIDQPRHPAPA